MKMQRKRPMGFTLTELLVVIAIIVVLAAVAAFVAGRAKEKAHAVVCMGNMRQIATDHLTLCQENNGVIVHAYRSKIKGGPARAWPLHHTVLRSDEVDWKSPTRDVEEVAERMLHLRCPSAYKLKSEEMDAHTGWRSVSTYAMNGLIGSDFDPDAGVAPWIRGAHNLAGIRYPATLVLAIEKEFAPWGVYGNGAGGVAKVHEFARFHNGGFNVAFYDGHVESAKHGVFPVWTKPGFKYGSNEFFRYWIGMDGFR